MSEVLRTQSHPHLPHVSLNDDGQRHPVQNSLAIITLVLGIPAFVLGFITAAHFPAVILGLIAVFIGLYDQMISATRSERMVIVTGLVAAFVGAGLGFAHGGFGI